MKLNFLDFIPKYKPYPKRFSQEQVDKKIEEAKQAERESLEYLINAMSLENISKDVWDIPTLDEVRKRLLFLTKKEGKV